MEMLKKYIDSIYYPLTLGALAFIGWITKFPLPSAIIFSILAFFPLMGKDGRGYLSLILMSPIIHSTALSFNNIDLSLMIMVGSILISLIIFLILRHPHFVFGRMIITMLILLVVFSTSLITAAVFEVKIERESGFFLFGMFGILALYAIILPILYEDDSFSYFAKALVVMASVVAIEVFFFYGREGFKNIGATLNLGWIQSSTMASTLLVISLPFSAIFLSRKKVASLIPVVLAIIAVYQLRTVSGLLAMVLVILPLIFMIFAKYKFYPYYVIGSIGVMTTGLVLLFIMNNSFMDSIVGSLRYFGDFFSGHIEAHNIGIKLFLTQPFIGPSINSLNGILGTSEGYIRLLDNTIVTTLVMGGSLGLIAYAGNLINIFSLVFQRKNPSRYFFLVFLLLNSVIGLIDNTFYNLFIMFIFFLAMATYEASSRKPAILIQQNYFSHFTNKRNF